MDTHKAIAMRQAQPSALRKANALLRQMNAAIKQAKGDPEKIVWPAR